MIKILRQYLHIADYKSWQGYNYSGKVLPLKVEEYEYGPSDARLDNMKDYSVYFVGASLVIGEMSLICLLLKIKLAGSIYRNLR